MNEQEIRPECLKLALEHHGHVKQAQDFTDFVLGKNDGEVIAAARELAEKINAS